MLSLLLILGFFSFTYIRKTPIYYSKIPWYNYFEIIACTGIFTFVATLVTDFVLLHWLMALITYVFVWEKQRLAEFQKMEKEARSKKLYEVDQ